MRSHDITVVDKNGRLVDCAGATPDIPCCMCGNGIRMVANDFCSEQLHSTLLTLISSIFQLAALLWYLVSYFPMGSTGLQYMGRFGASRVSAWVTG